MTRLICETDCELSLTSQLHPLKDGEVGHPSLKTKLWSSALSFLPFITALAQHLIISPQNICNRSLWPQPLLSMIYVPPGTILEMGLDCPCLAMQSL